MFFLCVFLLFVLVCLFVLGVFVCLFVFFSFFVFVFFAFVFTIPPVLLRFPPVLLHLSCLFAAQWVENIFRKFAFCILKLTVITEHTRCVQ